MNWLEVIFLAAVFFGLIAMLIYQGERVRAFARLNDEILSINRALLERNGELGRSLSKRVLSEDKFESRIEELWVAQFKNDATTPQEEDSECQEEDSE